MRSAFAADELCLHGLQTKRRCAESFVFGSQRERSHQRIVVYPGEDTKSNGYRRNPSAAMGSGGLLGL
jgi:hypothetical protein